MITADHAQANSAIADDVTRYLFSRLGMEYPQSQLREIIVVHNGSGLKSEDRDQGGEWDVFASGGKVGRHSTIMHSGPFVVIGRKGSAGKLTYASAGGWVTDTAYFATPISQNILQTRFLYHALRSKDFSDDIIATAIPGINRTAIYRHFIPVPPIDVQVATTELLDYFTEARGAKVRPSLSGSLTGAGAVIRQIEQLNLKVAEARRLRSEADVERSALRTAALRKVFSELDGERIDLEDLCAAIVDNLHSNPRYSEDGVPCIRSPDVGFGTLDLVGARRTDEEEYVRRTVRGQPRAGDIVLVREGGGTGKCALVESGQRFSLGQRVMMLRPDESRVLPKFFLYQLLSPVIQEDHIQALSKGSAAPHLNIGSLRRFPFIVPPIEVQHRIIQDLDLLQKKIDAMKAMQTEVSVMLEAVIPSMLDQAHKGELYLAGTSS